MWYFNSPQIVFGEDALSHLEALTGRHAFIVTDAFLAQSGLVSQVRARLDKARLPSTVFAEVEPEPALETARRCAAAMTEKQPDWIIGLGGGSCMDAAKAAWLLYERPDVDPAGISPMETFGLRAKARLITIPTTSGTGSEVTWATVLTDTQEQRKLGLATRELLPDLAIVDPVLVMKMPPALTAFTGLDALTHAVEGFSSGWANDFSDGLCLKAAQLVFAYLPRAVADGSDAEAREKMHNAATIAGLGFGNSQAALAHAMGHSLGALFHMPHGLAVSVCLPYTLEYIAKAGLGRYLDLARFLGLPAADEAAAGLALAGAVRDLMRRLNQPLRLADCGMPQADFQAQLEALCDRAELDTSVVISRRIPDRAELRRLFEYTFEGRSIDF
jgi:alcohol dehydrogenase class IV